MGSDGINSTDPVVSVCIANYNGGTFIEACIRSILNQISAPPIEIIVHDDCSTDGSADFIAQTFPKVTLLRSEQNVGFCISNNRMARVARGRYLLLLNNDAALFQDAINTLYSFAQSTQVSSILGLPQYDAAQPGKLIDMGSRLDLFMNPIPARDVNTTVGMVTGACLWVPRDLWQELGGFPEWFGSLAEDLYLCQRARLAGRLVTALPNSGYSHWVGRGFGGGKVDQDNKLVTTRKRRALTERNKSYVMAMAYPLPLLLIALPLHVIFLGIEGLLISTIKRDFGLWRDIYWNCLKALWENRPILLQERHIIQSRTTIGLTEFMRPISIFPYKLRLLWRHGPPSIT